MLLFQQIHYTKYPRSFKPNRACLAKL